MTKTFLLADDDSDDIDLFCDALKEIDRSIHCKQALNGLQLLNTLLDNANPRPDIIFLDINMPVMNGWKCLKALKEEEKTKDIPVIIYTTSSEQMEEKRAKQMGALCFYKKPDNYEQLKQMLIVVSEHVEKKSFHNLCEAIHRKSA